MKVADERIKEMYNEFVDNFGNELVVFPNALDFMVKIRKFYQSKYEKLSKEEISRFQEKHKLKGKSLNFSLTDGLTDNPNELAVFFNEKEGQEMLTDFNFFRAALTKNGSGLTKTDEKYIFALLEDESVSPAFLGKVLALFGNKSVLAVYFLNGPRDIDYLVRKYKGFYFRNRYPNLTLIDD